MNGAVSHLLSLLSEANDMGQACANEALRTLAKDLPHQGKEKFLEEVCLFLYKMPKEDANDLSFKE